MEGVRSWGTFLFHYACFLVHLVGVTYYLTEINLDVHNTYGGRFKFLTFINMLLHFIYFNMAAVTEIHGIVKKRESRVLSTMIDYTFACFVFPVGLTVAVLFWVLYLADPNSCQTKEEAEKIPSWLNHYMHSFPLVVIVELWFIRHSYPKRKKGILFALGFAVVYAVWILCVAFAADIWVYPFLERMTSLAIAGFFAGSFSIVLALYLFGEWLNKYKWGGIVSVGKKIA